MRQAVPETIGQRIRRLRKERRLSQQEISGPGVSHAHISRIEGDIRTPSVKALRVIASRLGVPPEYLETGKEISRREQLELQLADAELMLRSERKSPAELEEVLETLTVEAIELGVRSLTARAQALLGLVSAKGGKNERAVELLEAAATSGFLPPLVHPDVYEALARSYSSLGRSDLAVRMLESSLGKAGGRESGNLAASLRLATNLSSVLVDAGELEKAREVLAEALKSGSAAADSRASIDLFWSRARTATTNDELQVALDYMRRALGLARASEDMRGIARAHCAYAQMLGTSDRAQEAASHFDLAERLFELGGSRSDLGRLRAERAKNAVRLGEGQRAVQLAGEAIQMLGETVSERGHAHWGLALGRAQEGDSVGAEAAFREAVDLLDRGGAFREAVRACRDWAEFLRSGGGTDEALSVLERANELVKSSRSRRLAS
jgi:transcriptional regulator with XRE-family HTH domain